LPSGRKKSLIGVISYQAVTCSPDSGHDRTGIVYDSSTLELVDLAELNTGVTHNSRRCWPPWRPRVITSR